MKKSNYWDIKPINSLQCIYNVIFGERSNGKTYGVELYALERYCKYGEQFGLVRRFQEDFTGKRGAMMFSALVDNNEIGKLTHDEWTDIFYYSSRWWLCRYDENGKREVKEEPFAFGFAISSYEHDKSTSYNKITTILFDEFITRDGYLTDEFVLFQNTISTIVRDRDNVKIYMCGNTVNAYNPYFSEMGLYKAKTQEQGTIDVYTYGDSALRVAVEYCGSGTNRKPKKSDVYFAFNNSKIQMITQGSWEIAIYPHAPIKWTKHNELFHFFIKWTTDLLQCDVVSKDGMTFIFVHVKTTPLKDEKHDLIYSTEYNPLPNWKRKITQPTSEQEKRICRLFAMNKVFYQDNETGEIMRNYLQWCRTIKE